MKKVLILAYDFPPYVSVGGLRPYSWYKYFNDYGIDPIVVTRQWDNKYGNHLDYIAASKTKETISEVTEVGTIIRTPYKPNLANKIMLKYGDSKFSFIRKAISAFYEFGQFVLPIGTKYGLYKGAKKYLKTNKVDYIIATGSPHILFKYASKLSKKNSIPWVADYRDPWSQSKSRSRGGKLSKWNEYFEKKYLKNVSFITVASKFFKYKVRLLLADKQFVEILNGYDNTAFMNSLNVIQQSTKFSIVFAGTIYKWHPIESVLNAYTKFVSNIEDKDNVEFLFYGINHKERLLKHLNENCISIKDNVRILPRMNNVDLLPKMAEGNVMLLFNDYSVIGTKIYDYLAVKRKIFLCYKDETVNDLTKLPYSNDEIEFLSNHVQEDVILETNSGLIIKNREDLYLQFNKLYLEFIKKGLVVCESHDIDKYSRRYQCSNLAQEILNNI